MFREHGQIVLTDFVVGNEDQELKPGYVGFVVHVHPNGQAAVVEFTSLDGDTAGFGAG